MLRKIYILLIVSLALPSWVISQICGTTPSKETVDYMRTVGIGNTRAMDMAQGILDIPYQLHILRQSDGTGGLAIEHLKRYIKEVNKKYLAANLRFVPIAEPKYVDASRFYDFKITDEELLAKDRDVSNALNIYCLHTIEGGYYGYTYHPSKSRNNRLFLSVSGFENGSTFPHELGHFFGLYHTHGKGAELTDKEEPIDRNLDANGNGVVDCYETGDDLCDTPADPNLGLQEFRNYCKKECNPVTKIPHQSGKYYQPKVDNIMCYNQHSSCRTQFTKEQVSKINQTARQERKHLIAKRKKTSHAIAASIQFLEDSGEVMPLSLDINLYRFIKEYKSGDAFSFEITNTSVDRLYLSIVNMDTDKEVFEVYPMEGDLPFILPNEKINPLNGLIRLNETVGKEYVCLLFSLKPIPVKKLVTKMKYRSGTFSQRLYGVLSDELLPLNSVSYQEGAIIDFKGAINNEEILPVMMEMNHN